MPKLRDYQRRISDNVLDEFSRVSSSLVVCPTGTGKTVIFADIIQRMMPTRAMVLAHREELIFQARQRITDFTGLDCDIEMGELHASKNELFQSPVVISTVQTQCSLSGDHRRMGRFRPEQFGLLIIDECFPAGTLIDGRPIESVRESDVVYTHKGIGTVTHTFKKTVSSICEIRLRGGRTISCTTNHPIWTSHGFKPAWKLTKGDMVATITQYERLHNLRKRNRAQEAVRQPGVQITALAEYDKELLPKIRRRNNQVQEKQRHESSRGKGVGVHQVKGDGVEANSPTRKRTSSDHPRISTGFGPWVGYECCRGDESAASWFSKLLQAGCRKFLFEDWGGDRWKFSPLHETKTERQQKGGILEFDWVESVEIHKQGSGEGFDRMCPGGLVYNLEVSNGNTYFANGVLVHNCHHSTASTYTDCINYYRQNPKLKVLGVTATPDRHDKEALGKVFETVADTYEIVDAIEDGWLVPVMQQFVTVDGLDYSGIRTTAGDLNGADLAKVMEAEDNLQGVAGASIPIIENRKAIVFASSVKQAEILSSIFNRYRAGMSDWVCGKTDKDKRRQVNSAFAEGDLQVICNCGTHTEGFDAPAACVCIMARPTKSRALYAQMAGRVMRPLAGIVDVLENSNLRRDAIAASSKPNCLIVDFVGNSGKHKLINSADILSGRVSEQARERAVLKAQKAGGAVNVLVELEEEDDKLKQQIEDARIREQARRAKLLAQVKFSSRQINPFDALQIMPWRIKAREDSRTLSEKQRMLLLRQGIDPSNIHHTHARQIIQEMFRRWDKKLCTMKQANVLNRFGYETHDMTMVQASSILDALARNHWRPIPKST